jgi:hypothetical protein
MLRGFNVQSVVQPFSDDQITCGQIAGAELSDVKNESHPKFFGKGLQGDDLNEAVRQVSCTPAILIWLFGNHMREADIAFLKTKATNGQWLPRLA